MRVPLVALRRRWPSPAVVWRRSENVAGPQRTPSISWRTCRKDFEYDGGLRDIYITPATLADWRAIYLLLRDFPAVEFEVDGVVQPLPATVEQVFALRSSACPLLGVPVGPEFVNFHFFVEDEIECDIWPSAITRWRSSQGAAATAASQRNGPTWSGEAAWQIARSLSFWTRWPIGSAREKPCTASSVLTRILRAKRANRWVGGLPNRVG